MANLQFGDHLDFSNIPMHHIDKIQEVVPIKYDTIEEAWVVVAQKDATHMIIVIQNTRTEYIMLEIGKCENLYLLADAIVD